jgi:murein L,D-transpeptidase YcbB/YkuD
MKYILIWVLISTFPIASASAAQKLSPEGETKLRQVLADGQRGRPLAPNFRDYRGEMANFYRSQNYALAWILDHRATPQARALVKLLEDAVDEGLRAEDYEGQEWPKRLRELEEQRKPSESDQIDFDAGLTAAVMRYVSDRHVGRINPKRFHFELTVDRAEQTLAQFLRENLEQSPDAAETLRSIDPVFPAYTRLLKAYRLYRSYAGRDEGETLPIPRKAVRPGGSYAGLPRLRRLLTLWGDLPAQESIDNATLYTGAIVKAVKHYQRRHGLKESGNINPRTLEQLNVPLSRRVTQFRLTLERLRWLPHGFTRPPLIVNIPEFRLHVEDDDLHWVFFMNIVVGKAYKRKTPVFESRIERVVFRPFWNIPKSIQREEVVPRIKKDPGYLTSHDYEVIDQEDNIVTRDVVDPSTLQGMRSGLLSVRQRPGPDNSLGLVKFVVPNSNDVYLHGTPAKQLFSQDRRDFSHGCIRVEDPAKLAAWVLRDEPEWTPEKIRAAMEGPETVTVVLAEPIPVLVIYGTAAVMENGERRFFDDIYGYDKTLEEALRAPDR